MGAKDDVPGPARSRSPLPASPSAPRKSGAGPPPGLDNSAVIKNAVSDMGTDLAESIMAQVAAANTALAAQVADGNSLLAKSIIGAIEPRVKSLHDRLQETIDTHQVRFTTIEDQAEQHADLIKMQGDRISMLEESFKTMQNGTIKKLERRVGIAESATPDTTVFASDDFDRALNPTILTIGAEDMATKKSVTDAAAGWLDNDRIRISPEDPGYIIKGRDTDKSFTVQFTGEVGLAAGKAITALDLLRNDGNWLRLTARTPPRKDLPDGVLTRLFINPDKNGSMRKVEIAIRDLTRLMLTELPDCRFSCNKKAGILYANNLPLAHIECISSEEITVKWHNVTIPRLPSFDHDKIRDMLTKGKQDRSQWSL